MIRHLRHSEIDKRWWDDHLLGCQNRMWYVQSWVLDLTSPQWEALVDDESGAIMPLTWRRKYLFKYLFQPYGTQQQGVFAPVYSDVIGQRMLRAIPREISYCDIALNEAMGRLEVPGATFTELDQQVLPLDHDIETLRMGYAQNHRRNLRKATGSPIVSDVQAWEFVHLFRETTAKRYASSGPADLVMMEEVIGEALRRDQCIIHGSRTDKGLHAAAVFMEWQGRGILYKSAADEAGTAMMGMFKITDHYIAGNAGSGKLLDFAGSSTPSVARFNSGFGAERRIYLRLQRNDLPPPFKWFKQ